MAKETVRLNVYIPKKDHEYLKEFCGLAGVPMSELVREMVTETVGFFRSVFGDSLGEVAEEKGELYMRRMIRFAMLEIADVLGEEEKGQGRLRVNVGAGGGQVVRSV